ncbi:MAG: restriction endonuclease subunit S, partial [Verrucomicrobiales bacterium]|nr:restriction endonuclease subunit S [Verrucomicrobiales bacterium]
MKRFEELCRFIRGPFGGSLKKNCFVESGYAVYEQQHAIYNQFENIRYFIDDAKFDEMKRFELLSGDLIMSCSGTMGKVAIVPEKIQRGIINQALLKLTPTNFLKVEYLSLWMISNSFQESLAKYTVGAAIKNVASVKILKKIKIPIPPLAEQEEIVEVLDKAFAAIDQAKANLEQNIANAKELFQSKLQSFDYTESSMGNLVNIKTGKLNSNAAVEDGEFRFFTCSREVFQIDHYAFDCEAILLAGNNASGDFNVKHYKGKFNAYQRTYVISISDEDKLDYRYLYHQLTKGLIELTSRSVGSKTKFLRIGML